jgi:hypothetical protein
MVPWAEPQSWFTFDFEQHIAYLAQRADKTGDDHGKARRFDRVERDRRVRRSSDGEARSSQRTSAFAVAV